MHLQGGFVRPGNGLVRLDKDHAFTQAGNDFLKLRTIDRMRQDPFSTVWLNDGPTITTLHSEPSMPASSPRVAFRRKPLDR
jgi:hypothetical protein